MKLENIFKEHYHLTEKYIRLLFENMEKVSFPKKEIIQQEEQMDRYLYFVESGIVRSYITREGKEIAMCLTEEGGMPVSLSRLTQVAVSKMSMDAITDCVLWQMARKKLEELCNQDIVFANFARHLAENLLVDTELYWTDFYWMDKKKQYELLLKRQPDLLQRISLNDLATYLNVTPQSLSRIRASID